MSNKVAVIGIGRLGLCFALNLERAGYDVLGIDVNSDYVDQINAKTLRSPEPELETYLLRAKKVKASTDFTTISSDEINSIFCLVSTPSKPDGTFSHEQIEAVVSQLLTLPKPEKTKHLIIACTTMPGYCEELGKRLADFNYSVSYNPEFIAQGTIIRDQQHPDQILIGEGHPEATLFLREVYAKMCVNQPEIHVMTPTSAEITKLATNCFLTMKISFANAIGDLASSSGAEIDKVLAAIGSDSRIGSKYLKYGFGFGGPCFPRDNQALLAYSSQVGHELHLSRATIAVNRNHLDFQLNELLKLELAVYDFDTLAYKKGTDILEESQQLQLALALIRNGKKVRVKREENIEAILEKEYPDFFEFY